MIFSHGLGGNRNSYSYNAGSLASHGMVVVCAEHRDGSAVSSLIRQPQRGDSFQVRINQLIPYREIAHKKSHEVFQSREDQLRIRLWELGLIHDAILSIDSGKNFAGAAMAILQQFRGCLDVHEPGHIMFSGHSFGATTIYQLLKCTYYADRPGVAQMRQPLFSPSLGSSIRQQITEKSVTILLDMWCLPLLSPNSKPLFDLPLPVYRNPASCRMPLLAIESESFFRWDEHLHLTAKLLCPGPYDGASFTHPQFYYVVSSAHASQSDFGILFPWVLRALSSARDPQRILRLNLRAQLQLLRANGVPVSQTCASALVDDLTDCNSNGISTDGDRAILRRSATDVVSNWKWIDITRLQRITGNQAYKSCKKAN